jgi:hypothetical protein
MPPNSNCLRNVRQEGFLHGSKSRAAGDRRKLRQALPEFLNIRRLLKKPHPDTYGAVLAGGRCHSRRTVKSYITKAKLDDKNPITTSGLIRFHDRLTKPDIFTTQENETKKRLLLLDAELTQLRDGNQSFFQYPPHTVFLGGDRETRFRLSIEFSCTEDIEHFTEVIRKGLL